MADQNRISALQKQLLTLTAAGTIITAFVVATVIALIFFQHDRKHHELNLTTTTKNRALAVEEYLDRIVFISMQVTSRTFARNKLQAYQNNEISLGQLQDIVSPILTDAMTKSPEILGISRLGQSNELLTEVGLSIPPDFWPLPTDGADPHNIISPPITIGQQTVIIVGAKIFDRNKQHLGTDIIAFSNKDLVNLQQDQTGLKHGERGYIGHLYNRQLITIKANNSTSANELNPDVINALSLGAQGNSGILHASALGNAESIIAYTQIGNYPWALAISAKRHPLYSPIRNQIGSIIIIVAALTLGGIGITYIALRPLTGRILMHSDELEEKIYQNTIELQRNNHALSTISACSNAIIHAQNEQELLRNICEVFVNVGGYRLAWVGYAQQDKKKTILPVAQAGFAIGDLDNVRISWAEDDPDGQGPAGISIRSGAPYLIRDMQQDVRCTQWRNSATKYGFASVIGLPLTHNETTFGTLLIHAAERNAFDQEEVRLLCELAEDLAYGITSLRTREERHWAEQELTDSEERWRSLTENSPDHILTLNTSLRIEFANNAWPGMSIGELIGKPLLDFIDDPVKQTEIQTKLEKSIQDGIPCSYESKYISPTGETICYESIAAARLVNGKPVGLTLNVRDITQRKLDEAKIEHLAYHDELTGLPNRRLLMNRLEHNISIASRHHTKGALLFLDLDRFKTINDSLGHAVGDAILCEVANRLKKNVRAEDSVSRLGGDEFMVLLPELKQGEKEASFEASVVAEKLRISLSEPYILDDHQYHTTPSIGIVIFPYGDESADDVLKHADTAMYRAKAAGRNEVRFYRPSMQEAVDQRLALEKGLRKALEEKSFQLHYQPLLDNNNNIVGTEALLRWHHKQRGWITPEDFIPVAEETGLILPLGEWVLQHSISQLKQWQHFSWSQQTGFMAINISARQFHQKNFVDKITYYLQAHGVNPEHLKLELTESLVIEDITDTVAKMEALRELGVRIAIDDFGTGYSSLAYLKRLPIDQIKIDKSFVLDITENSNDAAIVETIISVARHLSLGVIAEGVETIEILNALKHDSSLIFQGYYFSHPLPHDKFEALMEHDSKMTLPL